MKQTWYSRRHSKIVQSQIQIQIEGPMPQSKRKRRNFRLSIGKRGLFFRVQCMYSILSHSMGFALTTKNKGQETRIILLFVGVPLSPFPLLLRTSLFTLLLNNISRSGSSVYIILDFPSWLPRLMILTPTCMGHSTHYHTPFPLSFLGPFL